jgi:ABC-type multidrug transport system ATPase subunit
VAVLGSSGAGKTTLMLAIAGYQPAEIGSVRFDGADAYRHAEQFRAAVGYVPQSDIVHQELPLARALEFGARLRLPADLSDAEIHRVVRDTLVDLDLADRALSPIRALSGGERKRANIAAELLSKPSLLFLDEPTSGLDAGLERRIVALLRRLAQDGRTVVSVTHSLEAIDQFDKILVMAKGGRLAYFGPPKEALAFFGVKDFSDMYDAVAAPDAHFATRFEMQPRPALLPAASRPLSASTPTLGEGWHQFKILVTRYLEILGADRKNLAIWLAQAPAIAAVLCAIYEPNVVSRNQSPDRYGRFPIQDLPTLAFLLVISVVCFGLFNAAREIVKERRVYDRERHVGLRLGPYLASKVVVLATLGLFQAIALVLLVSLRVPLTDGLGGSATIVLLLALGGVNATMLGLLVSAASGGPDQAITLSALVLLALVVFSGLVPLEKLNILSPFAAFSASRWSFGGIAQSLDIPARFEGLSLGSQVHDVLKTDPGQAAFALLLIAGATLAAAFTVMRRRTQRDVR